MKDPREYANAYEWLYDAADAASSIPIKSLFQDVCMRLDMAEAELSRQRNENYRLREALLKVGQSLSAAWPEALDQTIQR